MAAPAGTTTATTSSCTLAGKIALVTGGGRGIGLAICQVLAREGARLVVTDVTLQAAKHTLTLLPAGGQQHVALAMDVRDRKSVEDAVKSARDQCGAPPSLLVNNAGVLAFAPVLETDDVTWQKNIDVNLTGLFLVTQAFAKSLLASGKDSKGAIVNIASILGKTGCLEMSSYTASKGAVITLTKTCAAELASKGIRVNSVMPGLTDTPMLASTSEEMRKDFLRNITLGRFGRPEEIAEVVAFLLSDRSSYMVGSCVEVTGGYGM